MKNLLYIATMLLGFLVLSQEIPPILHFSANDYAAGNQNWMLSQGSEKRIYAANNSGLLEFDGERWKLYSSPNESVVRSVKVIEDKVFTGMYMDFGYWERDVFGTLVYVSLLQKVDLDPIEDEQFWKILDFGSWIVFQSLHRLVFYHKNTNEIKVIDDGTPITSSFLVDKTIYFQKAQQGLFVLDAGQAQVFVNHELFYDDVIVGVFKIADKLQVLTSESGLFQLVGNRMLKSSWPANKLLQGQKVYTAQQLKNGGLAIGTVTKGLLILDAEGKLEHQINFSNGLANNTVLSVFEDHSANIWLGLDNGIDCLNVRSKVSVFQDLDGKIGTVYASAEHNGKLYLGTNQGLYVRNNNSSNFVLITSTAGQVWTLFKTPDGKLLCGHDVGTFEIQNNHAQKISDVRGTWNFRTVPNQPQYLLQGNYDGLYLLERRNDSWQFKQKLKGFENSSKFFEFVNDSTLFVSHEYKGVFKLELDPKAMVIERVVKEPSLEKGLYASLVSFKNDLYYHAPSGVFQFDREKSKFQRLDSLSALFENAEYITGKMEVETDKKLWFFSKSNIIALAKDPISQHPITETFPIEEKLRRGVSPYEHLSKFSDGRYLLGTNDGFLKVHLSNESSPAPITFVQQVEASTNSGEATLFPLNTAELTLENNQKNLQFSFSTPNYQKYDQVLYQHRLKGFYDVWSTWSPTASASFSNLRYGTYTFEVRVKVNNTVSDITQTAKISIARPWYLSNTAIFCYSLAFLLIVWTVNKAYTQYYRKERQKLIARNEREWKIQELANRQEMMKLRNDQLRADIESKNRELAISTMSTIKRNKFLVSLKEEIKQASGPAMTGRIIKLIDRNMNNEDDWNFFEEAFNNADKDFLKRIKKIHPKLTHNDLRLCAYLRLNLSSKEIAPLLNISVRSVEIKRYRLRKKMDLAHGDAIVDYIMTL